MIQTKNMIAAAVLAALPVFAGTNLVPNPGFEQERNEGWRYGGVFGGAKGFVRVTRNEAAAGKQSLQFHKEGGGGAQIFAQLKAPQWNNAQNAAVHLSFRYKGRHGIVFVLFREAGSRKQLKNELGRNASVSYRLKETAEWTQFSRTFKVPQNLLRQSPLLDLQFQLWGQGDLFLDEVSVTVDSDGREPAPKTVSTSDYLKIYDVPSENTLPPLQGLPFQYGEKDGVLTRDGKPFFYTGNSTFGGGQYVPETIWLARLLNYSMVTLDWGLSPRPQKVGDTLEIHYADPASSVSMFRELARNGLVVEHDTGNAAFIYSPLKRFLKDFPQLSDFLTSTSHFYSYDHNTEIGRRIHFNGWKNRYRYLKGFPVMATEIYNELGYTPTHERVQKGFREFAKKKYGTLAEANKVWGKDFKSWDTVFPPHLSPDILPGEGSHGFRKQMQRKYWQLNYDWLRYTQLDLIPGLAEMKKQFRTVADSPFMIDWRGHGGTDSDGYAAVDPDLLDTVSDINGLHTGYYCYDYRGQPADEISVVTSLAHNVMHFDFVASNNRKVTINPECIVGRTTTPGSNLESMKQNSFRNFAGEWKFRLEPDRSGMEKGYFKPGFDDSKWDVMTVPGCWDETARYRDKKGFGWYRTTFTVPARMKADYEDGSRRFCLYGKGVAQKGTVWINGVKIGEPKGWNTLYKYDVSPYLNYGGENQITCLVDGSGYANGLRFFVFVLPEDRISETRLLEKRDYASLLWSHMMHGASGVVIWHWDSPWRPFMAELNREIANVSEIALPASRNRKAKAAMLMPFLYFRGLPTHLAKNHRDYMTYFAGMLFHQTPAAVLSEGNILKATPERYSLILYPYARVVQPETFRHFTEYVKNGGTAVVTLDSLRMDFHRYRDTGLNGFLGLRVLGDHSGKGGVTIGAETHDVYKGDMTGKTGVRIAVENGRVLGSYADGGPAIAEIRRGKGRVIFVAANLGLSGVHALLGGVLKQCGIRPDVELTDTGDRSEFPYVEAQLAGNRDRFLIYLHNWGGRVRDVAFLLPFPGEYVVRNVRNLAKKPETVSGSYRGQVDPSGPAAWLFERKGTPMLTLKGIAPERLAVLKQLERYALPSKTGNPAKPKILFLEELRMTSPLGRLAYPNAAAMAEAAGAEVCAANSEALGPEALKQYRAVFIAETNSNAMTRLRNMKSPFIRDLLNYVKNGGNLIVCASSMATAANTHQSIWWRLGPVFRFSAGGYIRRDDSCGYGDPYQPRITEFRADPVTEGLKAVQMFVCREFRLRKDSPLKPLLLSGGKPVMIGGKYGKGRVVFVTDVLWMSPTRAEVDDNALLLSNLMRTMLESPAVTKEEALKSLVLTEQQLREMEAKER